MKKLNNKQKKVLFSGVGDHVACARQYKIADFSAIFYFIFSAAVRANSSQRSLYAFPLWPRTQTQ